MTKFKAGDVVRVVGSPYAGQLGIVRRFNISKVPTLSVTYSVHFLSDEPNKLRRFFPNNLELVSKEHNNVR